MLFGILQILFFGIVALILISKLLSILGYTDQDELTKDGPTKIIDAIVDDISHKQSSESESYNQITNNSDLYPSMDRIRYIFPDFTFSDFLKRTRKVFELITTNSLSNDNYTLFSSIIDRKVLISIIRRQEYYELKNLKIISQKISNITEHGNIFSIHVNFVTSDIDELWIFTKNTQEYNKESRLAWYLTEIINNNRDGEKLFAFAKTE